MSKSAVQLLRLLYFGRRAISRLYRSEHTFSNARSSFYKHIWQEAANETGRLFIDLGSGICEIHDNNNKFTRVYENYTELDNIIAMKIAGNKPLVLSLLAKNNISIPRFKLCNIDNLIAAEELLRDFDRGCVVKPAVDTAAGAGVSANVAGRASLIRSAAHAAAFGKKILIEEHVQGNNYRLLYLNGKLLDVVQRKPPSVTGDGKTSINGLVRNENILRKKKGWDRAQTLLSIDEDMKNCLNKQRLSLNTILPKGETIHLKTVINQNNSSENERVSDSICQSIINDGAKAVKLIGAQIAGVDIVTNDPTVSLQESKGAIIEVNTTPGYYYHYKNTKGALHVASHILETIFRSKYL